MKQILKELGLNKTETDVYLALLNIGNASASIIAYQCNHNRSTVRYACNKLVEKGLLNAEKSGMKTVYSPESPFKLLFLLEEDKRKLQKKEDVIHRIIAQLNTMIDPTSTLPRVRSYEGLDKVKKSCTEMLEKTKSEKIYSAFFSDGPALCGLYDYFVNEYQPKRLKKGIKSLHITLDTPKNREFQKRDPELLREMRFISENKMPKLDAGIIISDHLVCYMGYTDSTIFTLAVEDVKIGLMFRNVFDILWSIGKS